jgi:cytochrome c nitrite reductase small subunit
LIFRQFNASLGGKFSPATGAGGNLKQGPLVLGIGVAVLFGALTGLGAFTFHYGQGISYFGTESATCANCHIMQDHYDSWRKSSHSAFATCADCHLPDPFPFNYLSKAENGWSHSWAFTLQDFHEPIQIKPRNSRILQNNCIRCHGRLVHSMLGHEEFRGGGNSISCVHCHLASGHGPAR